MSDPLVSCLMCTYGRPVLLGEAVKCFIDQDYQNKELVILNDQVGVKLVLENCPDNIRIYNMSTRFSSLGQKRNYIRCLADGDFYCIWDDDDLYMPWRITSSIDMFKNNHCDIAKAKYALWSIDNSNYGMANNLFHSQACITKEYMQKTLYPDKSVGEDAYFEKGANVCNQDVLPFYVYRWGNCGLSSGVHHVSGMLNDKESWEKSLTFKPYYDITGETMVKAEFQKDYWKEIGYYLKCVGSSYSIEWNKRIQ